MANPSVSSILDAIAAVRTAFDNDEAGSREALIDSSRALIAALEIPSEFVQRTFWAEVSTPFNVPGGLTHSWKRGVTVRSVTSSHAHNINTIGR